VKIANRNIAIAFTFFMAFAGSLALAQDADLKVSKSEALKAATSCRHRHQTLEVHAVYSGRQERESGCFPDFQLQAAGQLYYRKRVRRYRHFRVEMVSDGV